MNMKELVINVMAIIAMITQNKVLSWIGTIILVWFIVNLLIAITEPKKVRYEEESKEKEAEEE